MNVIGRNAQNMDFAVTAPLKTVEGSDIAVLMEDMGRQAKSAARALALAPTAQKNKALAAMATAIRARKSAILAANAQDLAEAKTGTTSAFLDRLALDDKRVAAMADGLDVVRALADPVGLVTERWTRPNGMTIERVRVPLGVVGIIYESRPNVTADAAALCLKAGNAAILRGGSDSHRSNRAIHAALIEGMRAAVLPEAAIALVPTRERAAVGMMLAGLDGTIDVIVPRGGKSLVARVQAEARVPVFAHLEGICHVYVDKAAKLDMARTILLNAKMRRTGVCGAAETLLVDRAAARTHLKPLITMLLDAGCEVRGRPAREGGRRRRLVERISRRRHRRQGCRRRGRCDRAYRALRLAPHRLDRDRGRRGGGEIPERGRFRHRPAQRLDPVRRRRRVRLRRRNRHRHRPLPRARAGWRRAVDHL
jgi:glutamate-5-semialdehyde dehydrogenase